MVLKSRNALISKAMSKVLQILVDSLAALPLKVRTTLGAILGNIFSWIPTKDRQVANLQLQKFLPPEIRPALSSIYANLGRTLMESLNLAPILRKEREQIECNNWQLIKRLQSDSRGYVVLTAHTGNWDLMAAYFINKGLKIAAIGRQAQRAALQPILASMRQNYGLKTIWKSDSRALQDIIEELKSGHIVAALIDQDTDAKSIWIPFFGRPAKTPCSMVEIAKRLDLPILSSFIFREPGGKFKIFLDEIDSNLSIEEILTIYSNQLETLIRRFPSQWVWVHKRWRSSADGNKLRSNEYIEILKRELSNAAI